MSLPTHRLLVAHAAVGLALCFSGCPDDTTETSNTLPTDTAVADGATLEDGGADAGSDPGLGDSDTTSQADSPPGDAQPADMTAPPQDGSTTDSSQADVDPAPDAPGDTTGDSSPLNDADASGVDAGLQPDGTTTTCPSPQLQQSIAFSAGAQTLTVTYDNQGSPSERSVRLLAPIDYNPQGNYPLFFLFHGSGGNAAGLAAQCAGAHQAGYKVLCVVPQGAPQVTSQQPGWNLGGGQTLEDDVAFVHAIWGSLDRSAVDEAQVFALGTSMGSAFSGNVLTNDACSFFNGVVQSATQLWVDTEINAPGPMSVLILHGEDDGLIPIDGGTAFGTTQLLSVEDSLAAWATHNDCVTAGQPTVVATSDYTRSHYADCPVPVALYRLNGQGHATSVQGWFSGGTFQLALEVFVEGQLP